MKLIDADAIIEVMKKCAENPENEQALLCYRYTQRILEEAPTVEPASPWHRVEEPPKENGRYLVYMFTSDWRWEFKFASYLHDRWIGTGGGDVRYWMPIEPPKEVQE